MIMKDKEIKILNSAIEILLHADIEHITMDDLAKYTNSSKITIYKYFNSKDSLFYAIGMHIIENDILSFAEITESNLELGKKLELIIKHITDFTDYRYYDLCKKISILQSDFQLNLNHYLEKMDQSILRLLKEGQEANYFKASIDEEILFTYIKMGIEFYQNNEAYRNKMIYNLNFREQFLSFFLNNINN